MNGQLDLFLDSQAVSLINDVIAALGQRDSQRAAAALDHLRSHAPDDAKVPMLQFLTRALRDWHSPAADSQAVAAVARWLDVEVAPVAQRSLSPAVARRFIAGFFRELADTASGLAYSAAQPTAHRAWLCLRCGAWAEAEEAALSIPSGSTTPEVLHWLACARYRQRGLAAARPALFALAWRAPQLLAATISELHDELIGRDWLRFSGSCAWEGVDDEELPAWFPARYLLEHSVTGRELDYFNAPATAPAEAARLLNHILDLETLSDWRKLASARDKLRKLNTELFDLYMATRSVQHR